MQSLSKFYSKIQEIEEALSFNQTFKSPDAYDKIIRIKEELIADGRTLTLPNGHLEVKGRINIDHKELTTLNGY